VSHSKEFKETLAWLDTHLGKIGNQRPQIAPVSPSAQSTIWALTGTPNWVQTEIRVLGGVAVDLGALTPTG